MAQQQFEYLNLNGVIIPDTETTRDDVANEFKAVFGEDLNTDAQTPQGVLITEIALERNSVLRNNAQLANQINPNLAGGKFFDSTWALTGGQRFVGSPSTALCLVTGIPLTPIPAGSQAKSTFGDIFISASNVTLDAFGNGSVNFQCEINGPVNAPAGSINEIESAVLGWETITNPDAATLGKQTQSDGECRVARSNSLALQGTSTPEAIISALTLTNGVKGKPKFLENITDVTQIIENVTMVPHSIFVCVDGGLDADIANVLISKKSAGCNFNGTTTINYTDPFSFQVIPVKFSRPDLIPILVRVTIGKSTTPNPVEAVKSAILAYANGEIPGSEGLIVGQDVETAELSKSIGILFPDIFIIQTEISFTIPIDYFCDTIFIESFQRAVIVSSAIEVIQA